MKTDSAKLKQFICD